MSSPWREMPARFVKRSTANVRYRLWIAQGLWLRLVDAPGPAGTSDPDAELRRQERRSKRVVGQDGEVLWLAWVAAVRMPELRSLDTYGDADHAKRANRKDFVGNSLNAVVVTARERKP
jgi:hypothetical protein